MATRLADRLADARRRSFVGRAREIDLFRQALRDPDQGFCVLHVYGPGGVGKSTLLGEFRRLAISEGARAIHLDGINIAPSPEGFVEALRLACLALSSRPTGPAADPLDMLADLCAADRCVLLIDSYELLTPIDGWLRDGFLPQLPGDTVIVLAGRNPPTYAWRADPGWQEITRAIQLDNLATPEALDYLARRRVPPERHAEILAFTRGHPLALSLATEVLAQGRRISFEESPPHDVVHALLRRFVAGVESPEQRAALEACALVRVTTEPLLAALLDLPEGAARPLFGWLRDLSFISRGARGIYPHDLARTALAADLRWRNPDLYARFHHRARRYYLNRLRLVQGPEKPATLIDLVYLHENPLLRALFVWNELGGLTEDAPRTSDWDALVAMVVRHEGAESAAVARAWFTRQPESVSVIRGPDQDAQGFICFLSLREADLDLIARDPGALAAWSYLQRMGELPGPGEIAGIVRYWMAGETYQAVSPAQGLIWVAAARLVLTTPRLVRSFHVFYEPAHWVPVLAGVDIQPLPEANFTLGSRSYGMFTHDWRAVPPDAWLAWLADHEMSVGVGEAQPPPVDQPEYSARAALAEASRQIDLGESEFAAAVRDALRSLTSPAALAENPLARSRLISSEVVAGAAAAQRGEALRRLLLATIAPLEQNARDARLYRALYHTYVNPALSQEAAAELADVPFSTFRRHLKEGVDRVTAELWARERAV